MKTQTIVRNNNLNLLKKIMEEDPNVIIYTNEKGETRARFITHLN